MKLELYYFQQCPFCLRVLHKIDKLNLSEFIEFKDTLINRDHGDFHYNKTGRSTVPCLYIEGEPMFESTDIINWLDLNAQQIKEK